MTSRERVLAALQRKQPDRVPTFEWVLHPRVMHDIAGTTSDLEFITKMDIDGVSISLNSHKTKLDDRHYVDDWGITRVSYDEYPNPVGHPIATLEDFRKLQIPDPDDAFFYRNIEHALVQVGKEKTVIGRVKDIFSQPRDLMGFEEFMMAFYLEPELIDELMTMCVEQSTKVAKNLKSLGVEVVVIGDDIANNTGLLIKPDMFREQVLPHLKRLVMNMKEIGLYVIKHSDGDLRAVVEDLIDTGIDCLDPIDPLGNMNMRAMKQTYGGKIALKGNVDCVDLLVNGSEEQVRKATAQCILEGSQGGGHIISSSNSIHSGINPLGYKAFLDAVKELGVYPLDIKKLNELAVANG